MTAFSRRLRLYSTRKKNQARQIIDIGTIITLIVLIFLIGQQIFFKIKSQQKQIAAPRPENIFETITQSASERSLEVKSISEEPDMIILLLEDETKVFLDKRKPIESQLNALQLIINQDRINGRKAKKIDLRFNNPIVTY